MCLYSSPKILRINIDNSENKLQAILIFKGMAIK